MEYMGNMTKEEFIRQIERIEKFHEESRVLSDTINKILYRGSASSISDFGFDIIQSHIKNISTLSGISVEIIESYLYEDKGVWVVNGKEGKIDSASKLWDIWYK